MSERELLELAAKAAGYQPQGMEDGKLYLYGIQYGWNPLEDDGDALRLAVKLGMEIRIYGTDVRVSCCGIIAYEGHPDLNAATRRAIVRAAAEIGRAMP